jgi:hypothetical protein
MTQFPTLEDKLFNQQTLAQQLEDTPYPKPYNPNSEVEEIKTQELAIATGAPQDEIRADRQAGADNFTAAARTQGVNFDYALTIDEAYRDGKSPEEIAQLIQERKEKGNDMSLSEYLLIQNLMLSDNDTNPYAARTMTNMDIWNRLMKEAIEENDQSGWSKTLSFLDVNVLREITIGAFENVTFRSNREGKAIREAFNTLSPSDFQEWAAEYIEERKAEGIFSEDSIWNLYKAANDATYLGDDPMAGVNFLFGALDIATLGTTAAAKASSFSKAVRPIDVAAILRGEAEAGTTLAKIVDDTGISTDQVTTGRALPEELDVTPSPKSRPSNVTVREGTRKTTLTEKLEEMNRRGSFGEYVPREVVEQVATRTAQQIAERTNDVVVNTRRVIDEGSEDFKVVVRLGKDGSGAPFRRKMDAEEIAKRDPSLKVVSREDGKRGWFLETEERINVLGLPEASDVYNKGNFIGDAINKVFGASSVRLGDKIGGKFLQAESGQALIGDLIKPYEAKIRKVKGKELENLSDFMTQLRDGDLSYMRKAPDSASFEALYKTMYGAKPNKKTVEAYEALQDINDTTWQIKSSERLKRVVAEGGTYVDVTDEFGEIGYRVSTIPDNELVFDAATNRSINKANLPADAIIFKIPNTFLDHLYVTNVTSTRVLERVDVMPYNVGGPRTNQEFRWFVGSTKQQRLASGNTINSGFKTMLGSFGKDQATKAVSELNAITRKTKELMDLNAVDDIQDLILSQKQYDELGDVIRQNNTWNKHVTDLEDLQKLAGQYGFRFTEDFVAKARDEKVSIREAGEDVTLAGSSFGEVVGTRQNMKRGDTPLMEFGGKKAVNANPVSAIADQFGSEAFGYANRAATQNAIVGWVKLAQKNEGLVNFPNATPSNDYLNLFMNAEVTKTGKFNDVAAQLRETQDVIKRRLNQNTWLSDKWDTFTSSATEAVFGLTGKKIDFTKADPASRLLQVGFYSKFGFLNPDQFMLQGLHSLTIAAISPVQGIKALGLTTPLMVIANLTDGPARSLAIRRLAQVSPIPEEDLQKLIQYIDESGRNIIDTQIIELQAPQKFGAASTLTGKATEAAGTLLDKSTIFFKEGDRVTRIAGMVTAFLEHRAKRPDIDPLSPDAKLWITNREQDLTFRMTTGSRSFIQSGPMRVPTQWLSFSFRALENIVVGRNFTAGERARMFAVMGPMYGLVGLGAGQMTGYVTEKMGYNANDDETVKVFNRVKYGVVDALLSNFLDTETAYAQRVAPLGQIQDTYKKLFEESFFTTLFGPSGEIAGDMLSVASNALRAMYGGRTETVREDLTQLVRNLSTADKAYKIREIIETGNYRSRTRKLAVGGLSPNDAASVLFGATPAPVQNYYDYTEMVFKENQTVRDLRNRLQGKANYAVRLLTEGDKDDMIRGTKLFEEITDEIWASNLSNTLKIQMQNSMVRGESLPEIMKNAMRLGLEYDAQVLQQQMQ